MKLSYLGHSSFIFDCDNKRVLIDPFFCNDTSSYGFERKILCKTSMDSLKKLDLILITHKHFDHFQKEEVEYLSKKYNAVVVSHSSVLQDLDIPPVLKYEVELHSDIELRGVKIKVTPAHYPRDFYPMGYIINFKNNKIYHAGDTKLIDYFSELSKMNLDLALLPIGGKVTMDLIDAVRATKIMKPKYVVPMHYNTFDAFKVDPRDFKEKIEESILKTKAILLEPGKSVSI